jgi:hypothetical protein
MDACATLYVQRCKLPVLQAALVKFSSFDIKEGGKMNTYSQFETVDTAAGQFLRVTHCNIQPVPSDGHVLQWPRPRA